MSDEVDAFIEELLAAKPIPPIVAPSDYVFRKYSDRWVIKGRNLREGAIVEVSKSDGSKTRVVLDKVLGKFSGLSFGDDEYIATFVDYEERPGIWRDLMKLRKGKKGEDGK